MRSSRDQDNAAYRYSLVYGITKLSSQHRARLYSRGGYGNSIRLVFVLFFYCGKLVLSEMYILKSDRFYRLYGHWYSNNNVAICKKTVHDCSIYSPCPYIVYMCVRWWFVLTGHVEDTLPAKVRDEKSTDRHCNCCAQRRCHHVGHKFGTVHWLDPDSGHWMNCRPRCTFI